MGLYDKIFKPKKLVLANGKVVEEKCSCAPLIIILIVIATWILSLIHIYGLLTAAVVEHLIARGTAREISVVLYENDKNIQSLLKKNIEIISSYCSQKQVKLFIKTQKENFIVDNQKYWEMQKSKGLFDIVISNPPYLKIRKEAAESVCMSEIVHGQPNMYFLFMAMAVKMLRTNGEFVFITPRSWTSGTYFKSFRSYFMDSIDVYKRQEYSSKVRHRAINS